MEGRGEECSTNSSSSNMPARVVGSAGSKQEQDQEQEWVGCTTASQSAVQCQTLDGGERVMEKWRQRGGQWELVVVQQSELEYLMSSDKVRPLELSVRATSWTCSHRPFEQK